MAAHMLQASAHSGKNLHAMAEEEAVAHSFDNGKSTVPCAQLVPHATLLPWHSLRQIAHPAVC